MSQTELNAGSNTAEKDFEGAFVKHPTSSFVNLVEECFSEHQLKTAWYKISCSKL